MDSLGNLYIADTNNHRVRKVEQDLSAFTDEATLKKLLIAVVQSEDISAYLNVMEKKP